MGRNRLRLLVAGGTAVAAIAAAAVGVSALGDGSATSGAVLLPDLDQETPTQIEVREQTSGGRKGYFLGFRSAVRNIGDGPLVISGNRVEARSSATMDADQLIEVRGGSPAERIPAVGRLRFVTSPDHDHWHLLGFDRYELRPAGSPHALVRDQKTGFCLGDRYPVTARIVAAAAAVPVYTEKCGLGDRNLTSLEEGISVGYGDDYAAYL
jgi:hypothetical protein